MGKFQGCGFKACDDVCGKKRVSRIGDAWWWNEEVKKAVSRKKDANMAMCLNSNEENKRRYKCLKINK